MLYNMKTTTEIQKKIAKAVSGYLDMMDMMSGYPVDEFTESEQVVMIQVVCAICDQLGVTEGMSLAEAHEFIAEECGLSREVAERLIGMNGEDEWGYL